MAYSKQAASVHSDEESFFSFVRPSVGKKASTNTTSSLYISSQINRLNTRQRKHASQTVFSLENLRRYLFFPGFTPHTLIPLSHSHSLSICKILQLVRFIMKISALGTFFDLKSLFFINCLTDENYSNATLCVHFRQWFSWRIWHCALCDLPKWLLKRYF